MADEPRLSDADKGRAQVLDLASRLESYCEPPRIAGDAAAVMRGAELARRLRKRETANIMADIGSPLHMDIADAATLIETQAREIAELRAAMRAAGGHGA